MVVCQKCGHLLNQIDSGYYYCPSCKDLTYFLEFVSKC